MIHDGVLGGLSGLSGLLPTAWASLCGRLEVARFHRIVLAVLLSGVSLIAPGWRGGTMPA